MVENSPVRTLVHKGLTIEGYSRAAVQTYWRIPELKIGFDFGAQPWSFMNTAVWFVSHTHLDHIAALPVYVARRRMMKMEPPTIYLPEAAMETVERILKLFTRLDRGRLPCQLVPHEAGRRNRVIARACRHRVGHAAHDSVAGIIVWDRRRKLKPEYHNLPGDQIRDLRMSGGTEVTEEIRVPLVAFLGDSAAKGSTIAPLCTKHEF